MDKLLELGSRIKQRRGQLGYNQADLAEFSGISERTIRSIEKGEGGTSIAHWIKILDVLGLEMKILYKLMSDETRPGLQQ